MLAGRHGERKWVYRRGRAGADALDKFRVAVRKHKGRDLAKGKFSANAKKPDQYLKGRK